MIIDNFGTIKPNPYRWYRPRVMMGAPIVDEIDWSTWAPGPLMVVPEPMMVSFHPQKPAGRHVTTDPACARHRPPTTNRQRRRFDRARGIACTVCRPPTRGSAA